MAASKKTSAAAKRTSTSRKPSGADVVRMGLQAATAKANMDPQKWAAIVRAAHGQGYTVASAIDPSVPASLKQRTRSSLQKQSQTTISQAYAPQTAELDHQEQMANGLQAKRTQDEGAFNSWYAQQVSAMNARTQAAQAAFEAAAQKQADPTQQGSVAQGAQAQQAGVAAQVQQGASGDMSNSIYLKGAAERAQATQDQAKNQATAAVQSGIGTADRMNAATASIAGRHDSASAAIAGDYGKTVSDLTAARLKLVSERAGDQIKEYTRLLDQETSKANAQQQYTGLQAQLSQKASAQQDQNDQFYAGLQVKDKVSQRNAATAKRGQDLTSSTAIRVAGINSDAKHLDRLLKSKEGQRNRANALAIAAKNHPGTAGAPSAAEVSNSQIQVQVIHTIADIIHQYGSKFRDKAGHVTNTRAALISRGYSGSQIDAGLSLARHGKITNPSLYKQLGILPQHRG